MPVREAQDGAIVEPNHIYIVPSNKNMTISRGALRLNPRPIIRGHNLPIDSFFQSLAEYRKHKAIGVILSGTASDGTLGLKAIKAEEGITFSQDKNSAKFDGMPTSAITAGVVDFVMRPQDIAKEIAKIGEHPLVKHSKAESELLPEGDGSLTTIFTILRKSTGVDFTHYKPSTIMRRISRRMLLQKAHTLDAYIKFLKEEPKEVDALYEDILINVTRFFRDPEVFEILVREIFPKLLKSTEKPIRIWVPGCSTGEEPYSLAIALLEYLGDRSTGAQIQIFGTDISDRAIERARNGLYSLDVVSDVGSDRLRRFFVKYDHGFQIKKSIRDLCIFAKHNVTKDPPFSRIDLISCRNLLIYFTPVLQRKVVPLFHYALNPTGYLLLGNTETIGGFPEFFFPADRMHKVFSKKVTATKLHFESQEFGEYETQQPIKLSKAPEIITERDVLKEGERVLLTKYAPASVIVNDDFQILHFRGQTGAYLEPPQGQASLNLLKMAREGLAMELRSALVQARKNKVAVRLQGIRFRFNETLKKINLEVIPIKPPHALDYFYIVIFDSLETNPAEPTKKSETGKTKITIQRLSELELLTQELSSTKEYMQSIIEELEGTNEELRAANEEILSSNEELQSTNEEMETAKEELQSANEELTTVNEELQNRNAELNSINNDVNNLLASVQIPIVMLGSDLRIRRFTPTAEKLLNLISSDIGRPISDISMNISPAALEELISGVIDSAQTRDTVVQDRQGRWYTLQIRPYRTTDNKVHGAVLLLIDIDAMKRSMGRLQSYQLLCSGIVETLEHPLVLLNGSMKVQLANEAFYEAFNLSQEDIQDKNFFDVSKGRWNKPALRKLVEQILPEKSVVKNYLFEKNLRKNNNQKYLINARRLQMDGSQESFIVLSLEDISDWKKSPKSSKRK
jgi:two-component system CheB/CheR fusion protein